MFRRQLFSARQGLFKKETQILSSIIQSKCVSLMKETCWFFCSDVSFIVENQIFLVVQIVNQLVSSSLSSRVNVNCTIEDLFYIFVLVRFNITRCAIYLLCCASTFVCNYVMILSDETINFGYFQNMYFKCLKCGLQQKSIKCILFTFNYIRIL